MKEEKIGDSRKKKFFMKNGFFMALALGLIAVGGAVFTLLGGDDGKLTAKQNPQVTTSDVQYVTQAAAVSTEPATEEPGTTEPVEPQTEQVMAAPNRMPSDGTPVTPFSGDRLVESKTFGDYRVHNGVDLEAPKGTEIYSATNGTVEQIYTDELWGTVIVIDSGGGVKCHYFGLSEKTEVTKGQEVKSGEKLGVQGDIPCEAADSPHLHFGVTKDDEWVDPLKALGLA